MQSAVVDHRAREDRATKRATGNNTSICKHLETRYIVSFFLSFFLSSFLLQPRVDRSCPRPRNHRHPCSVYRNGSERNVFRASACLSSNINRAHPCSQFLILNLKPPLSTNLFKRLRKKKKNICQFDRLPFGSIEMNFYLRTIINIIFFRYVRIWVRNGLATPSIIIFRKSIVLSKMKIHVVYIYLSDVSFSHIIVIYWWCCYRFCYRFGKLINKLN